MVVTRSKIRSECGFSLVEVMTALLILSIGLLGVGTLVISSMQSDRFNTHVRRAEYLAYSKMEELRAETVGADLTPNEPSGEGAYPIPDGDEQSTPGNHQVYVRHWTIGSPNASRMSLVRVVVGWPYEVSKCDKDHIEDCMYKYRTVATILQR